MDMGRNRSRPRTGWPDNLYPNRDGFKYRHPVTRKETWMGTDRVKAFAAAKKLNALLAPGNDLVARVTGGNRTVADAVRLFREEDMPHRGWSQKTLETYESLLRRIEQWLGAQDLDSVGVKACAGFLRAVTASTRSRQQFRLMLGWVLSCAVEEGWIDTNPALQTRKPIYKRQRARLTAEQYRSIWKHAPAWLRNAMDLSLLTLLRREDTVSLAFADARDGNLWVVPSKTESTSSVRLKIAIDEQLAGLLARCRDDVLSPYVVHRLPEKARPSDMRAKTRQHHTQVLPEQLSRAFAEARDAAGIAADSPPTFHEIRSLGGALLRDKGWTLAQVQALMGHTSEAMTAHYMDGHDAPWVEVRPGLDLIY